MSLEARLATYISQHMPQASHVAVDRLARISGGASRETYRFRLSWREGGADQARALILRRDPPASLIDPGLVDSAAYASYALPWKGSSSQ